MLIRPLSALKNNKYHSLYNSTKRVPAWYYNGLLPLPSTAEATCSVAQLTIPQCDNHMRTCHVILHVRLRMYVCMHVCMYVCMYVCIYVYVYVYKYMYIYIHMYVYMYTCIDT